MNINDYLYWHTDWPNSVDWNFNFYKLLNDNDESPIGVFKSQPPRVAIIGAGIAGLMAARELIRSGIKNVDIYEASDRIGGRTYSIKAADQKTVYEMGAMRIPFFEGENGQNSVLSYYKKIFDIESIPFPSPGSKHCVTGIYVNDGFGPTGTSDKKPSLIQFKLNENDQVEFLSERSSDHLLRIVNKWKLFAETFKNYVSKKYEPENWKDYWGKVVTVYHNKDFRNLVFAKNITEKYDRINKKIAKNNNSKKVLDDKEKEELIQIEKRFKEGDFGGLGLSNEEATTFFTVGAGDGGWGAFYDISCLYVIRTLLSGYGSNLQLIKGVFNDGTVREYSNSVIKDTLGNEMNKPLFLGVQSFVECIFYSKMKEINSSIYQEVCKNNGINLYLNNAVEKVKYIEDKENHTITLQVNSKSKIKNYDHVIITTPTWATQVNMKLDFPNSCLPAKVLQSMKFSHWINSCKVFFPLKDRFWKMSNFPQVLLTDTIIQDMYIYAADENDPGVLLASYTWEDNAMKMLSFESEHQLAMACLNKLEEIMTRCEIRDPYNINRPFVLSDHVDTRNPVVIQWSKKPTYAGCAKLYRQNNEKENYELLNYNRLKSEASHLYFAGEAFSVEGGWIEPATRLALDAVIHVVKNAKGDFKEGFNYKVYSSLTKTPYLNDQDENKFVNA